MSNSNIIIAPFRPFSLTCICIALLFSSCIKEKDEVIPLNKNASVAKNVPFMYLDSYPIPAGCEGIEDSQEIRQCVIQKLTTFVNENFDSKSVESYAQKGENRIYVRFIIDTNGSITDIQARGPAVALEIEAKRVIGLIPKMIPGQVNGEVVNVQFSMPIKFNI